MTFTVRDRGPVPAASFGFRRWELRDEHGVVDRMTLRLAAAFAVQELNCGRAYVNRHLPVGCRVQPVEQLRMERAA